MNLILNNSEFREDGIFGHLTDETGNRVCVTLQHAYDSGLGDGSYAPKLTPGVYTCVRGQHKLHNMIPFETFKITGVVGHDNILFHAGNFNKDSEGCVLVGLNIVTGPDGKEMITGSKVAFTKLMDLESGLNSYQLTVK